jgi:hypothetical protein
MGEGERIMEDTTYNEPKIRKVHHYEWFKNQCAFFHEQHITDRWDLKDDEDSFQLYYQIRILSLRYMDLSFLLRRDHQYKRASMAYAQYWVLNNLLSWLFPFNDNPSGDFPRTYNSVNREVEDLEKKFEIVSLKVLEP